MNILKRILFLVAATSLLTMTSCLNCGSCAAKKDAAKAGSACCAKAGTAECCKAQ